MKSSPERKSPVFWKPVFIPRGSGGFRTWLIRLLQTDVSRKKKHGAIFPNEAQLLEIEVFLSLQHLGIPAQLAVSLAFQGTEGRRILEGLRQGRSLPDVLGTQSQWKLLKPLLKVMDLQQSVMTIRELAKTRSWKEKPVLGRLLYPVAILAGVYGMILFFDAMVLPMMLDFLEQDGLPALMRTVRVLYGLLLLTLLASGVWLYLGLEGQHAREIFLQPAYVRSSHSLYLASCLSALLRTQASTAMVFEVLEAMEGSRVFQTQIRRMKQSIRQGTGWQAAVAAVPWVDPLLVQHMETGLETGDVCGLLEVYIRQREKNRHMQMESLCRYLTMTAYGSVGFLAVLVYQVLLAPMNRLSAV